MALGRVTRKSRGGLSPAVLVSHSSLPDAPRVHPRPPWGCGPSPSPAPAPVSPTIGCRGWGSTPILRGSGPQLRALTSSGGPHAAPTSRPLMGCEPPRGSGESGGSCTCGRNPESMSGSSALPVLPPRGRQGAVEASARLGLSGMMPYSCPAPQPGFWRSGALSLGLGTSKIKGSS